MYIDTVPGIYGLNSMIILGLTIVIIDYFSQVEEIQIV